MIKTKSALDTDIYRWLAIFIAILIFVFLFASIIYWLAIFSLSIDFTSYYLTIKTIWHGVDPYHGLVDKAISINPIPSRNLNSPITLLLSLPLILLSLPIAYLTFVAISFILGLIAAKLSIHLFMENSRNARTKEGIVLIYCASFPVLLNLTTGQFGAILFFLIMLGYYGFRQKRHLLTSSAWALAISMKFFAGLLIIFCLQQKRYRLTLLIVFLTIILSLLPALVFGTTIYSQYATLLQSIDWYDSSWNASLAGYLSRMAECLPFIKLTSASIRIIWLCITIVTIFLYGLNQSIRNKESISFSLCLILMILLSPLGWIYYFSLLMPALILSYELALERPLKKFIWLCCFFFIVFPIGFVRKTAMPGCMYLISLYSIQTYGLILLIIQMLWKNKNQNHPSAGTNINLFWSIYIILMYGVIFLFLVTIGKTFLTS